MSNLFVKAIQGLLDDTNLFDRKEWANFLDVSVPEINRWLSGVTVPRSDYITMIYSALQLFDDIPTEPIEFFEQIAKYPSIEVSALSDEMLPTVWEYMQKPVIEW